jgi:hypothetical protein
MMDGKSAVEIIKDKFRRTGSPVKIPLQINRSFTASMINGGVEVDNLSNLGFLPWEVFEETVNFLVVSGGKAERGDAMKSRLGEEGLPLDSVEGHIALKVYGKKVGESVFRRISPVAAILTWVEVCESTAGELILRQ